MKDNQTSEKIDKILYDLLHAYENEHSKEFIKAHQFIMDLISQAKEEAKKELTTNEEVEKLLNKEGDRAYDAGYDLGFIDGQKESKN